ncbi:MAG: ABC transporter substrate-binding protein [Candidatus Tectomicrobia bacterium]|uniref:ABC transporter substrate-binding protein n=1 Tax=Tectimicrobiota bacterium TaxID=2528274 RepID=A0A932GNV7_UNCTE|nr:ABC transporter substrate-binding protein [Candidatus Tectomicrobia bacterium]
MAKLKLTIACGNYDRTRALLDGRIEPEGIDLNYIPMRPGETFWRMLNNEEFDASEMSLSSYTILRSKGDTRFVALPVFPSRIFRQCCVYVYSRAGIKRPQDLKGKRLGAADYQMTAAVWVRGFLQHDYGVMPEDLNWVVGAPVRFGVSIPSRVRIEQISPGQSLDEMLDRGEVDALIGVTFPRPFLAGSTRVRRLFPNYRKVEEEYYRRTGIFPIMHTFVLKTKLFEAEPWAAISLYKAFVQAKQLNYQTLYDTDALPASLPWLIDEIETSRRIFGKDIWNYSIEGSRPTLEALVQYLDEQGLTARKMTIEELFVPNIREHYEAYLESFYH